MRIVQIIFINKIKKNCLIGYYKENCPWIFPQFGGHFHSFPIQWATLSLSLAHKKNKKKWGPAKRDEERVPREDSGLILFFFLFLSSKTDLLI